MKTATNYLQVVQDAHPDITRLLNRSVGFDKLFYDIATNVMFQQDIGGFPPYDIIKIDDTSYRIDMAIAGYSKDEFDVETYDGYLKIGTKSHHEATPEQMKEFEKRDKENAEKGIVNIYLHRGIAKRDFYRQFYLGDDMKVRSVRLKDGMLTVELERFLAEGKKRKSYKLSES